MEIRQSFKSETMPSRENERLMRRFAGSCRFVYNKALATQQEMYAVSGKKHTYFQLCKLLSQWKIEDP
jgi:putative transposase